MTQMCPNCGKDNRDTGRFCAYCQTQLQGLLGARARLQNRYEIISLLGCGGMGAVYLALDHRLGQNQVAVKENFDTSPQAQAQFQREANVLARLSHPNLPKVIDHFIEPTGRQYLVMEYVGGSDLDTLMQQRGALPEAHVLAWADALLDALTYLHGQPQPVIHRDIKPSNIKLTLDGKVKLVDFGLVKFFDPANPRTSTSMRGMGTPEYAPPEQYNATGFTDQRSDIYSLGATLYHLLTGQAPATATMRMANPAILRPPRQIAPSVKPSTEAAILRAMELQMNMRFQSAAEMRQALRSAVPAAAPYGAAPVAQPPPSTAYGAPFGAPPVQATPAAPSLAQAVPQTPPSTSSVPNKKKPWLWLGVGAAALLVACIVGAVVIGKWMSGMVATPTAIAITRGAMAVPSTLAPTTRAATGPTLATPATAMSTARAGTTPTGVTPVPTTPGAIRPAATIMPASTPLPALSSSLIRSVGEPWEQDGVGLNMTRLDIRSASDYDDAAMRVWFRCFNKTGQKLLIEIDWSQIHLEDSAGNRYVDWEGGGTTSVWVEAGRSYDYDRYYTRRAREKSRVPGGVAFVQVVVDQFSRVKGARWQVNINPALAPVAAPSVAKKTGEAWEQGGLTLMLKNVEVRALSDYDDAAVRAWFALTNRTGERLLAEIDLANIYVSDSLGQRFSDWEGGGLASQWIDPGKTWEFDRYYSNMSGRKSRVTRGAQFVVVTAGNVSRIAQAVWRVDISSVLSSLPTNAGSVLSVGQPWEQSGLSLNMTRIDIRAETDYDDAAARVWFRCFNKTGQRFLLEVDWSKFHLEDSAGNRYVDWEGGGVTSVWVDAGQSYNFDRYYTRRAKEKSRVPGSAAYVRVMVDQFAQVTGAQWQVDINPALAPVAAPASAKGVSETWEQGGLALTLKQLQVRAESDYDDAAVRAWFALTNRTGERLLVEIDLAGFYVTDSMGRQFGDWEGGGLVAQWLDPGKTWEFDRYYSDMSGRKSRVTRGAGFVLVQVRQVGPLQDAQWRSDIVR